MLSSDDSKSVTWFEFILMDTFVIFNCFLTYIISRIITMIINQKNKLQNDYKSNKEYKLKEEIINIVPKIYDIT